MYFTDKAIIKQIANLDGQVKNHKTSLVQILMKKSLIYTYF